SDAITFQDGVLVKSGATTRRYLGTIRTTGTTTTEDSQSKRLVWNYYNQVQRLSRVQDLPLHTYNTATWRIWDGDSTNKCDFVIGEALTINIFITAVAKTSGTRAWLGLGINR